MKKCLSLLLTLILIIWGAFSSFAAVGEKLTLLLNNSQDVTQILTDERVATSVKIKAQEFLTINTPHGGKFIYLKWDSYPKEGWELLNDDGVKIGENKSGFLHEVYELPKNTPKNMKLSIKSNGALCDFYIFNELPDFVQKWNPPAEKADILIMSTHADDEHLYLGAPLALYGGNKDFSVQVAYMVQHNGEPYRNHELLNGLYEVGVRNYPVIPDFPDVFSDSLEHAKTIYDEKEILAYQRDLIKRFSPQVIVGQDLNGEYGHGAHMLNAHCLTKAIEGTDVKKLVLHLYNKNEIVMDVDTPLDVLNGKTVFERAEAGFACHSSQQQFFKVLKTGPYDMRKFGVYYSSVGENTGNDIMENITTYSEQARLTEKVKGEAEKRKKEEEAAKSYQHFEGGKVDNSENTDKGHTTKEIFLPQATNGKMFSTIGNFNLFLTVTLLITFLGLLFWIFKKRK